MSYDDWSWYKGNLSWLQKNTIFLTKAGSHAYGTNTATSDIDLRGIAIAPRNYYLGFTDRFDQAEVKGNPDVVIYDIRKFVELAAKCNPNVIELLFTDPGDWLTPDYLWRNLPVRQWWYDLYNIRHRFLSKEAKHRFSGYAMAQLKRLKSHRGWLLNQPTHKPTRAEFGLPDGPTLGKEQLGLVEARIRKLEDSIGGEGWNRAQVQEVDDVLVQTVAADAQIDEKLVPLIISERRYNSACREWASFLKWKDERNEARSELERRFGYDTKHAMHLVRLIRMAREILELGEVRVKRPDAAELLAIRAGAWTYDELMTWTEREEAALEVAYAQSTLPHAPDRKFIDGCLVSILQDFFEMEDEVRY